MTNNIKPGSLVSVKNLFDLRSRVIYLYIDKTIIDAFRANGILIYINKHAIGADSQRKYNKNFSRRNITKIY